MNKSEPPGIRIAEIILERAEFSHREDFLSHPRDTKVDLSLQYSFTSGVTPDKAHAVAWIDVKTEDSSSLYDVAFRMVALLDAEVQPPNFPMEEYVNLNAWVMLFPFLREAIANLTGRGRFGPILISPINIKALTASPSATAQATDEDSGVGAALHEYDPFKPKPGDSPLAPNYDPTDRE
jgi:preprotein translocase subunit SecB